MNLYKDFATWGLILTLMLSAFGMIYMRNLERQYISQIDREYLNMSYLEIEHNRLLLEKSAWEKPRRIQRIAESNLEMVIPKSYELVMLDKMRRFV